MHLFILSMIATPLGLVPVINPDNPTVDAAIRGFLGLSILLLWGPIYVRMWDREFAVLTVRWSLGESDQLCVHAGLWFVVMVGERRLWRWRRGWCALPCSRLIRRTDLAAVVAATVNVVHHGNHPPTPPRVCLNNSLAQRPTHTTHMMPPPYIHAFPRKVRKPV